MSLPVILCGRTEQIGTGVVANLKPEIDGTCDLSLPFAVGVLAEWCT